MYTFRYRRIVRNVVRNISASIGEDKSSIIAGDKLQFSDLSVYLDWSAFPLEGREPVRASLARKFIDDYLKSDNGRSAERRKVALSAD